jgi:hypothetical protein
MESRERGERRKARIGKLTRNLEKLVSAARASGQLPEEACEVLVQIEAWADRRSRSRDADAGAYDQEHEERLLVGMRIQLLGALAGEPLCLREFLSQASKWLEEQRSRALRTTASALPLKPIGGVFAHHSATGLGTGSGVRAPRARRTSPAHPRVPRA